MKLAHSPIASAPHPVQPSTSPTGAASRTSPKPIPADRTNHSTQKNERASDHRDEGAHERLALPRRETHHRHHDDRGEGDGYDDDAGQQAGVPVDHRQGDRDRGQRHQPQQRPVEPGRRAEQRPRHGRQQRAAPREPRSGGDVGVERLGGLVGRSAASSAACFGRGLRHARGSAAGPAGRPAQRAGPRRARRAQGRSGCRSRGHSTGTARREGAFACLLASRRPRPSRPVNSSTCSTAWCTSRSRPPTTVAVRRRGDERRGPRVVAARRRRPARPRSAATSSGVWRRRRDGGHHDVGTGGPGAPARHTRRPRAQTGAPGGRRASRSPATPRGPPATIVRTPRSASASPTEVAVAPPPEDRRRRQRGRRALTDGGDRPGQVGVVADPGAVVLEHQRVDGTGQARPVGEPVDQRQRLALEGHGQRESAPLPAESRQELPQVAGADPVGVVGPVQSQLGVRRPVQRRRQRVGDRVAQHAAAPARRSRRAGSAQHGRRSRSRSCTRRGPRGSRRSPRRTWSRPSRGRP